MARIVNSSHLNSSQTSFTRGFYSVFKSSTSDLHQYSHQVALARRLILSASYISISCIARVEGCIMIHDKSTAMC
jgi:hypothetical protein